MKRLSLYVALFFIAFIPRLLFILLVPYHGPGGDEVGYDKLAWSLAQGKGFVNEHGAPTSFYFPVYPYFVSFIYRLFGHVYLPVFVAQAFLSACLCVMLFIFAWRLCGAKVAYLSFAISTLYPSFILLSNQLLVNILFAVLFFAFFSLLMEGMRVKSIVSAAFCGVLMGLCALVRGECLFFLIILSAYQLLAKSTIKLTIYQCFIFLCFFFLTIAPWSLRNSLVYKKFIPLSTRGGITLYNSFLLSKQGFGFNQVRNAGKEYYQLKTEVDKDRYLTKKAIDYILHHPLKVLTLIPVKIGHLFYPFDGKWYAISLLSKYNMLFGLVFTFSVAGFIMLLKQPQHAEGVLLLLPVFSALLTASIFYGKPHYRMFIEPYLILACSYCLARWTAEKPFSKTFLRKIFPLLFINISLFLVADRITVFLRQIFNALLKMYPQG